MASSKEFQLWERNKVSGFVAIGLPTQATLSAFDGPHADQIHLFQRSIGSEF
jgi:hypothetical protein